MDDRFEAVFRRDYGRVVAYLIRQFRFSEDQARDVAQDVFLRTLQHMERTADTPGWMFLKITAHNAALNVIRSRATHRRSEAHGSASSDHLADAIVDEQPSAEDTVLAKEESSRLRDAIESLSPELHKVLLLRLYGLSYEEIANALSLRHSAVKGRLQQATKQLRQRSSTALSAHVRFDDSVLRKLMIEHADPKDAVDETLAIDAEREALEILKLRLAGAAVRQRRLTAQIDSYARMLNRHWDTIVNYTSLCVDQLTADQNHEHR